MEQNKKKSVAIMTYWEYNDNYGQILQAYALSYFIKKLGLHARLIKYHHLSDTTTKLSMARRLKSFIYRPGQFLKGLTYRVKHLFKNRNSVSCPCADSFITFKSHHLDWTDDYQTYLELKANPPADDYYICGSDMIWAESAYMPNPFFLNFGSHAKKIAYAPSFGRKSISKIFKNEIKPLLSYFTAVSVREASGIEICKSAGRNDAVHVPDPTLLLSREDYLKIEEPIDTPKDYIFAYLLGESSKLYMPMIIKTADDNNLKIIFRNAQGGDNLHPQTLASPGQWLSLIKNARHVFTNSFHGVIFSIIYRKPFTFLPLTGKGASSNERVVSILSALNLNSRIYNNKVELPESSDLFDSEFESRLETFVNRGKNFLKQNLK